MSVAVVRDGILEEIYEERDRQDAKWGGVPGVDRRDDHTYAAVLGEEVGEACKAWLERDTAGLRMELVQTAAVAVAWIEELDNGGSVARPPASTLTTAKRSSPKSVSPESLSVSSAVADACSAGET